MATGPLDADIKVEAAFGDNWQTLVPSWHDITSLTRSYQTQRGRRQTTSAFNAGTMTAVFDNSGRDFEPGLSAWAGYLTLTGGSGDYVSSADRARWTPAGTLDIRVKVALDDWTPTAATALVSHWETSDDSRSYSFEVHTTGALRLNFSTDGTATTTTTSTATTGFTDATVHWVRVTRDPTSGDVKFYTGDDGYTWTQLGTTVSAATGALYNSTGTYEIGARNAALLAAGKFYRVMQYDVANLDVDVDMGAISAAEVTAGSFAEEVDDITFTINGTGWSHTRPTADVDVGTPIRIRAKYSGTWYDVWRGFIEQIVESFPGKRDAIVTVTATDGLALLAASGWGQGYTAAALSAGALYRMDDASGTVTDATDGGYDLTTSGGTPVYDNDGGLLFSKSIEFDGSTEYVGDNDLYAVADIQTTDPDGWGRLTVAAWFYADTTGEQTLVSFRTLRATAPEIVALNIDPANSQVHMRMYDGTTNNDTTTLSSVTISTGAWHHIVIQINARSWMDVWLDGTYEGQADCNDTYNLYLTSRVVPVDDLWLGVTAYGSASATNYFDGKLSDVSLWPGLVGAKVNGFYDLLADSLASETIDDRINTVLDGIGWPANLRDIDSPTYATALPRDDDVTSVLTTLRLLGDTDQGSLFIDAGGKVAFQSGAYRAAQSLSATFGDGDLAMRELVVRTDIIEVKNAITVYGLDDVATATDATSIAAYGRRALSTKVSLTGSALSTLASQLVTALKDPARSIDEVTFKPQSDAANLWPLVGLEISDKVTIDYEPPAGGDPITATVYIEGISHTATPGDYDVTLRLSSGQGAPIPIAIPRVI